MFNSSSEQTPNGLQCADTVVYLRKGINNYFKLAVTMMYSYGRIQYLVIWIMCHQ